MLYGVVVIAEPFDFGVEFSTVETVIGIELSVNAAGKFEWLVGKAVSGIDAVV